MRYRVKLHEDHCILKPEWKRVRFRDKHKRCPSCSWQVHFFPRCIATEVPSMEGRSWMLGFIRFRFIPIACRTSTVHLFFKDARFAISKLTRACRLTFAGDSLPFFCAWTVPYRIFQSSNIDSIDILYYQEYSGPFPSWHMFASKLLTWRVVLGAIFPRNSFLRRRLIEARRASAFG